MKPIAFTLLSSLLLLCLPSTDDALGQSPKIEIRSDTSALSSDAILSAFGVLGLRIERFTYEAQFKHKVHFELREYRNGKLQETHGNVSFSDGPGNQSFSVYVQHKDETMEVSVEANRGRSNWAVSLKGLNAIAWSSYDSASVDTSTMTPIIGFAANGSVNGVTAFDPSEGLDIIASRYDLFVVVTAQIEKE